MKRILLMAAASKKEELEVPDGLYGERTDASTWQDVDFYTGTQTFKIGRADGADLNAYLWFPFVPVQSWQHITAATLHLCTSKSVPKLPADDSDAILGAYAVLADHALPITTAEAAAALIMSENGVAMSHAAAPSFGTWLHFPNMEVTLDEVIHRPGFTYLNAVMLVIHYTHNTDTVDNSSEFFTYMHGAAYAPRLELTIE